MNETEDIPIDSIRMVGEAERTQVRERTDDNVVEQYAEAVKNGDQFPAVSLVADGDQYLIADGWHRILAHRKADRRLIEAMILPSFDELDPLTSAIRYALRENQKHGLQLTRGDQRSRAKAALMLPEMQRWTNRKIAREIGVSHQTVARARNELVSERKIPDVTTGELLDDVVPRMYVSIQTSKDAFGGDLQLKEDVILFLRRLKAIEPREWEYDVATGKVLHSGLFDDKKVAFKIDGNDVIDGLPVHWEEIEEPVRKREYTHEELERFAQARARREFNDAARRLRATENEDLITAVETLRKYRDTPGLWDDIDLLVRTGDWKRRREEAASDF
jgi:hypothetical protein